MKAIVRGCLLAAALGTALALSPAQPAHAQSYPAKPIKLILPFAAGGAGDTFARPLAQALSQSLGQPVVIENIVGAAAIIGTQVAARAPADGYTLLMVSNALAIGETLSPKRGYLLLREFTPITQLNALSLVLVANPKLPVRSMAELIALAKSEPGKLNYASSGVGSIYHLPMEHLKSMTEIDIQHVPYKSSSQARMDVIAGEPSMMMDALATMQGQIKETQVHAIGVASLKRTETAPDIPSDRRNRSGLFWRRVARLYGARGHAAGHRQQAAIGDRQGACGTRGPRGLSGARRHSGGQHAGCLRRFP